ncbi:MAG: hypothetical protein WC510_06295 [Candidatus Omnitrophota bacterium]
MPKVLFINPNLSLNQRYGFPESSGGVEVPSGICCLAACLRSSGISTDIVVNREIKDLLDKKSI